MTRNVPSWKHDFLSKTGFGIVRNFFRKGLGLTKKCLEGILHHSMLVEMAPEALKRLLRKKNRNFFDFFFEKCWKMNAKTLCDDSNMFILHFGMFSEKSIFCQKSAAPDGHLGSTSGSHGTCVPWRMRYDDSAARSL